MTIRAPRSLLPSLAMVVIAACGDDRPAPLPDDRPTIQLSVRALAFELDAYAPDPVPPASAQVLVASSAPLAGAPTAAVRYESGDGWLTRDLAASSSGAAITVTPRPGLLAAGTYRATVQVHWEGAANAPATVAVALTIRPHPQTWRAGAPTLARRSGHTTTALPGGGAVAVGGFSADASIERLDAQARSWSTAGALTYPRYNHSATLLADGRVLLAGGDTQREEGPDPGPTWEIWDPGANRVTGSGSLASAHEWHGAARLLDGRVLLAGGYRTVDGKTVATQSCELFDPRTGTSIATEPLHGVAPDATPPEPTVAVRLEDGTGRVLALTWSPDGRAIGAELFDPERETWTPVAARAQPRVQHGTAALPGGRVLVFGGWDPEASRPLRSAELYDPVGDAWTPAGELHVARIYLGSATVVLPSGKVLVAGGALNRPDEIPFRYTELVETYDPGTGAWTIAGALQHPLVTHTVTVLADGSVWAVGGMQDLDGRPDVWREPAGAP